MVVPTKSRRTEIVPFGITEVIVIGGSTISTKELAGRFVDLEETTSEGHLWPPKPGQSLMIDRGGPFYNRKCRILSTNCPKINVTISGGPYSGSSISGYLGGGLWPVTPSLLSHGSDASLLGDGTTAITRCNPLKSKAQLGTALGELRKEGLPAMVGSTFLRDRSRFFRNLGGEYLNLEFGWKPFISDLQASVRALGSASKILTQLSRDSGKPVRRGYTFPVVESVVTGGPTNDYGRPSSIGPFYTSPGACFTYTSTRRKVWFSGEFMYHLPYGDDLLSRVRSWNMKAHKLLGARVDPELLWNLAPWTWLADWFGNVGDIVSNASAYLFDGLVMKYGYVMEHVSEVTRYETIGIRFSDGTSASPTASFLRETKRRLGATPYGFGLDMATLSEWQWSILAALGMNRR